MPFCIEAKNFVDPYKTAQSNLALLANRFFITVNRDGLGLAVLVRERENRFQAIFSARQTGLSVGHKDKRCTYRLSPFRAVICCPYPQETLLLKILLGGDFYGIFAVCITFAGCG